VAGAAPRHATLTADGELDGELDGAGAAAPLPGCCPQPVITAAAPMIMAVRTGTLRMLTPFVQLPGLDAPQAAPVPAKCCAAGCPVNCS
jgi:hypothetical protein